MDSARAAELIILDEWIDSEFRAVMLRLITSMSEDPRSISARLDVPWIAKALERIGDHAKNMAEYVVFVVLGHDIGHTIGHAGAVPARAIASAWIATPLLSHSYMPDAAASIRLQRFVRLSC